MAFNTGNSINFVLGGARTWVDVRQFVLADLAERRRSRSLSSILERHGWLGKRRGRSSERSVGGMRMIRVQIVDEYALAPDALWQALRGEPDFQIVSVVSCGARAARHAGDVDIALVNMQPRRACALEAVARLGERAVAPKVVIMGVRCPEEELPPFLDLGIAGYVPHDCGCDDLVETLRMAQRGEAIISRKLAAAVMRRLVLLARARERAALVDPAVAAVRTLTARECEVIALVGRGFSNQEIADFLAIEVGTVKNHVHNVLRKLDVCSRRVAAAVFASAQSVRAPRLPLTVDPVAADARGRLHYERRLPA